MIADISQSVFVPKGVDVPCLNPKKLWEFKPVGLKEGDILSQGDIFGTVYENSLFSEHSIMVAYFHILHDFLLLAARSKMRSRSSTIE